MIKNFLSKIKLVSDYPTFKMIKKGLKLTIFIFSILIIYSCARQNVKKFSNRLKYAKNFSIKTLNQTKILTVFDPISNQIFEYKLSKKVEDNNTIKIPVNKIICFSTTYIGYIEALGQQNKIVAVSGKNYVYNQEVRNNVDDIGFGQNLDIEKIINLKPDVIFIYDLNGDLLKKLKKLEKFGIRTVLITEFLEEEPLGRAEWIKFFAQFFDNEQLADSLFRLVEKNYNSIKNNKKISHKPNVLVNLPFEGQWYMPGGNSYLAKFIKDAGGNYLFSNNNKVQSFVVSLEQIYLLKDSADILINAGMFNSIAEILANFPYLADFKFVREKKIFNNNKRQKGLSNDFFESGAFRVDLILSDLNKIFRGDTIGLYFYKPLK